MVFFSNLENENFVCLEVFKAIVWNAINIGEIGEETMNEWDINIFWVLGRRKYWVALCRRHKFTKQECKLALGRGSLLGPRVSRS